MKVFSLTIVLFVVVGRAQVQAQIQKGQLSSNFTSEIELFGYVNKKCQVDSIQEQESIVYEIVRGIDAEPDRFPYAVSLQIAHFTDPSNRFFHWCGATLIAPDLILTAAHCVYARGANFRVESGQQSQGFIKEDSLFATLNPYCRHMIGQERVRVTEYYMHEKFNGNATDGYDIAVLKVEKPFNYDGPFANYEDSSKIDLQDTRLLTAIGWGATNRTDKRQNIYMESVLPMQMGFLTYYDLDSCQQVLEDQYIRKPVIPELMVCLKGDGVDTCWGDSGGAVMLADGQYGISADGNPMKDVQVAITSWGPDIHCGGYQGLPGVYTNVGHYIQWINNAVNQFQAPFQKRKSVGNFKTAPIQDSQTAQTESSTTVPIQSNNDLYYTESAIIQSYEPEPAPAQQSSGIVVSQILYFDSPEETPQPPQNIPTLESSQIPIQIIDDNDSIIEQEEEVIQNMGFNPLNLLVMDSYYYYDEEGNVVVGSKEEELTPQTESEFILGDAGSNLEISEPESENRTEESDLYQDERGSVQMDENDLKTQLIYGSISNNVGGSIVEQQLEPSNEEVVVGTSSSPMLQLEPEKEQPPKSNPTTLFCLMDASGASGGQIIQRLSVQLSDGCCTACLKNPQCSSYIHCTRRTGCLTPDGRILFYMQCYLKKDLSNTQVQRSTQLGFQSPSLVSGIIPSRIPS